MLVSAQSKAASFVSTFKIGHTNLQANPSCRTSSNVLLMRLVTLSSDRSGDSNIMARPTFQGVRLRTRTLSSTLSCNECMEFECCVGHPAD